MIEMVISIQNQEDSTPEVLSALNLMGRSSVLILRHMSAKRLFANVDR